jgi:hypothetical protein
MGVKRSRGMIVTIEDDEELSHTESEGDAVPEFNPDFEFDAYGVDDGVKGLEDDEGWGFRAVAGMKEGASVDLDGIISRRRQNLQDEESGGEEDDDEDSDRTISGDEGGKEEEEFKGLGDDEFSISLSSLI